jgi:hypothetical protein
MTTGVNVGPLSRRADRYLRRSHQSARDRQRRTIQSSARTQDRVQTSRDTVLESASQTGATGAGKARDSSGRSRGSHRKCGVDASGQRGGGTVLIGGDYQERTRHPERYQTYMSRRADRGGRRKAAMAARSSCGRTTRRTAPSAHAVVQFPATADSWKSRSLSDIQGNGHARTERATEPCCSTRPTSTSR